MTLSPGLSARIYIQVRSQAVRILCEMDNTYLYLATRRTCFGRRHYEAKHLVAVVPWSHTVP